MNTINDEIESIVENITNSAIEKALCEISTESAIEDMDSSVSDDTLDAHVMEEQTGGKNKFNISGILDSRFSNIVFFSMVVGFISIIPTLFNNN